jgi:threonine synthase
VTDEELRAAEDTLRKTGICVEPSSAAALAGLRAHAREDPSVADQVIVLIVTGAGLRWPATFDTDRNHPRIREATIEALGKVVEI